MPFPPLRWSLLLALLCLLAPGLSRGAGSKRFVPIPGGESLRRDAAKAFQRMHLAARRDSIGLRAISGYRSAREQRLLYRLYRKGLGPKAARPGRSNHQRGIAVDLIVGHELSPIYRWLETNACRHGFRRTVASEPWHWEYLPRATRVPAPGTNCLGEKLPPRTPPPKPASDLS
jgi:D-alanyl-D-alanine carboxypeptidase